MKVLAIYDGKAYLVNVRSPSHNIVARAVWEQHSDGKYRDECHELSWVVDRAQVIAIMSNDSEIIANLY